LLLLLYGLNRCVAQYVTIPDQNFANWLRANGFANCIISGNQLDTTCNTILTSSLSLDCSSSSIHDITGIQYFKGLVSLNCSYDSLTFIPTLPQTLQSLTSTNNQLTNVYSLPPSLFYLNFDINQLTSLPALPESLSDLYCVGNQLASLPSLPNVLKHFECSANNLSSLPVLPDSLGYLDCSNNHIGSLPFLPSFLWHLDCSGNPLQSLPPLPNSLTQLYCIGDRLTQIPSLPDSMYYFDCYRNPLLTCLPEIKKISGLLQFDSTAVACIPNYGEIGISSPPLSSLPRCDSINPQNCPTYNGISEIKKLSFSVYPDPASTYIQLTLNETQVNITTFIFDITGRQLLNIQINQPSYEIPIGNLPGGLYFVKVSNGNGGVGVRKLVKE
jgi:hypothetical protein